LGVVEQGQPSFLFDWSVLITGEVDRGTRLGERLPHSLGLARHQLGNPLIRTARLVIANVADRSLVVLTGCGHAGIIKSAATPSG
jgi:7,8-dihydropterin-6-yl-methyl-4-(beta-D-ribofuranosyl)aminobenzene 5'-phosphate synthase